MLGSQLKMELERIDLPVTGTDFEVDITSQAAVEKAVRRIKPEWIINCAAYTAVDKAESDEDLAMAVNGKGPALLAEAARYSGANLVHFSTDYVFDGRQSRPYREDDPTGPLSAYGRSKLAGEQAVREAGIRSFIFRVSWLYGVHGPNFVETMLQLFQEQSTVKVVDDQWGSPTWCGQLSRNIARLVERCGDECPAGYYHYQDSGVLTWYTFAAAIRDIARSRGLLKKRVKLMPVSTREFPTAAPRPKNSRLDTALASRLPGFELFHWKDNLQQYFDERRELYHEAE